MWIQREISKIIEASQDPIQIIRGPRQCGKSSLLLHLDSDFEEVSLDDLALRELAQTDPELFLSQFGNKKLFIDEAQYAPKLFPSLKRKVDLAKRDANYIRQTIVRITGSNQILMDKYVKESLAGRASFFDMNTLSVSEILAATDVSIQDILFKGGWPELNSTPQIDSKKYLDDYISSYIEKDIVLSAGIQKSREFLKFTRLLAGRVGQLLEFSSLANDVGVDAKTIKDWISILEKMHIIYLVAPYASNLTSRLVKSPKVFFIDTGLACRLQGWPNSQTLLSSTQQGPLFENLVFSEIYKLNLNHQIGFKIYHWRTKDKEEVDFLIEINPQKFLFIEAKVSAQSMNNILEYPSIRKVFKGAEIEYIQCHQEGTRILGKKVPIALLAQFLLNY